VPLALTGKHTSPRLTRQQYSGQVTTVLTRLASDTRNGRSGNVSAGLRSTKAALDRTVAQLVPVRAPADAAVAQRALLAEFRDYAAQVDLLRASVDFGDVGTIASHLKEVTAPRAINHTLDTLAAKGYDIPVRLAGAQRSVGGGG